MASNYDDVLGQLVGAGLLVDGLDVGRMRRCRVDGGDKEKRGWYHLHEIRLPNGDDLIVGSYGIWSGNESNTTKVELRKQELSAEQRDSLRKRLAEDKRRSELARKGEAARAAERAAKAWRQCTEQGDCDYLHRKAVGAHGVRFSPQGAMVIPMLDVSGSVHGLQIIRGKDRGTRLEKEFWPAGLAKKGHFHQVGMPTGAAVLVVAEGYATAASVYEATGLPVAVAFDAGNLAPVAAALRKRYKTAQILIAADADDAQKCRHADCKKRVWLLDGPDCPHCNRPHGADNAGVTCASAASLEVNGAWLVPAFADPAGRRTAWLDHGKKQSDFNDLHASEGLHAVRAQVEARLLALNWRAAGAARAQQTKGGGEDPLNAPLRPIETLDECLERFTLVYGQGGTVFDHQEHRLVEIGDMRDACINRAIHREWAEHPEKKIARVSEVGFDPGCADKSVLCNLWRGWPTKPIAGDCSLLQELLAYMCGEHEIGRWVLCWLAYPLQHPGAKMKTALVFHGPQGTGKNLLFEVIMWMYGEYGRMIDQSAIEDKFNDWASRMCFLLCDEVVARADLYHIKNRLKSLITGDWIRINPKGMRAYDERNHANMVFLSNEAMPTILEEDDRRHCVVWTPEKREPAFYTAVRKEIANGGAAAFYHYLLHLDLGEFNEGTLPPANAAKQVLVDLSLDSPSRFVLAFEAGDVDGFPGKNAPQLLTPCLSQDFYELYGEWCRRQGLKALNQPRFANMVERKHKGRVERKRLGSTGNPVRVLHLPGGHELPPGRNEGDWLQDRTGVFKSTFKDYRGSTGGAFS